ncbi:MAG: hypothetical protein E2O75_05670 [Chloroflexi bacterium]|nr:MAG: hypothetical protein E2O75_05670 [Chloroflexota bacterium]
MKRQKVCGRIEHVSSGRSVRFASQTEFDRFVIQVLCEEFRCSAKKRKTGSRRTMSKSEHDSIASQVRSEPD